MFDLNGSAAQRILGALLSGGQPMLPELNPVSMANPDLQSDFLRAYQDYQAQKQAQLQPGQPRQVTQERVQDDWLDNPMIPLGMGLLGFGANMMQPAWRRGAGMAQAIPYTLLSWASLKQRAKQAKAKSELEREKLGLEKSKVAVDWYNAMKPNTQNITPFSLFASGNPEQQELAKQWIELQSNKGDVSNPVQFISKAIEMGDEDMLNFGIKLFEMQHQGWKPDTWQLQDGSIVRIPINQNPPPGAIPVQTDPFKAFIAQMLRGQGGEISMPKPGEKPPGVVSGTQATKTQDTPPRELLKEGVQTTFDDGSVWMLKNGQPIRIR